VNPVFDKLTKILTLEKNQGYRDRAVIGGLERFLPVWEVEVQQALAGQSDGLALAQEIISLLDGYAAKNRANGWPIPPPHRQLLRLGSLSSRKTGQLLAKNQKSRRRRWSRTQRSRPLLRRGLPPRVKECGDDLWRRACQSRPLALASMRQ
jgi:hypothetical protein